MLAAAEMSNNIRPTKHPCKVTGDSREEEPHRGEGVRGEEMETSICRQHFQEV